MMIKLVICFLFSISIALPCTNFIVTKGASVDGSTMISYAADAGGFMEPLFFSPAKDWKATDSMQVFDWDSHKYLGKIPQAPHTYNVVGNINEWQVSMGETTFGGRDKLRDTTAIIDYGSLMYIVLQRCKSAREAIHLIDTLTKKYGYYSSGESFSIADASEAWIMEVHPKGVGNKGLAWAAIRIPDGYIAAHANKARIKFLKENDPDNCLFSSDVISFAKEQKIDTTINGRFSFADTYSPLDEGGALFCEGRVWRFFTLAAPSANLPSDYWRAVQGSEPYPLFIKPDKKISVKDMQNWMRDHFEGTEFDMTKGLAAGPYGCPYRWKSLEWKIKEDTATVYGWERPISTQQTAFSFIAQLREDLPREIGGVLWYGVDDAATTCYIPLYCSIKTSPKEFEGGSISKFDFNSGFWIFNLVANRSYQKYSYISKDIKEVQADLETRFFLFQGPIEKSALELYAKDKNLAIDFLTDYSLSQTSKVLNRWKALWEDITVKYNDGYINDVKLNGGRTPKSAPYDQEFLKQVIKEKPGYYDVKWRKKTTNQ